MNKPRGRTKKGRSRNGQGTVYQRQDGGWAVQFTMPDGKRKSYGAKSEEEAWQIWEEERHKIYQGVPTSDNRLSMRDFLAKWLEDIKGSVRASTWERYQDYVRLYITPEVGNIQLRQLSPSDVQALCNRASQKGLSASTVHHLRTVLHTALAHAIAQRHIVYNAAEKIKLPKIEKKEMQTFSEDEVTRFFEAVAGDRLEALYVLAIWTGMRQGELLALRWCDVDLDARVLTVNRSLRYRHQQFTYNRPKSDASTGRLIKIEPDAIEALRRHQERQMFERKQLGEHWQGIGEHQDLIFTNHFGGPMDASNLLKYCFYPALKKARLKRIRWHDLRHTFATLQLKAKTPAKTVSTMLGHSTISITLDTYTHVDLEEQDEALEAMKRRLHRQRG